MRAGWRRLAEAQEDWGTDSYGPVAPAILSPESTARPNPLILRGLGVSSVEEIVAANGPLAEFRDRDDREIIREALLRGVPAILTTDLRSFWAKREVVLEYGLEVWRLSDALRAYISRWNAQEEEEFARRPRRCVGAALISGSSKPSRIWTMFAPAQEQWCSANPVAAARRMRRFPTPCGARSEPEGSIKGSIPLYAGHRASSGDMKSADFRRFRRAL